MDSVSRHLYIPQHLSVVFKICQEQWIRLDSRGGQSPARKCICAFELVICLFGNPYAQRLTLWPLHINENETIRVPWSQCNTAHV